MADFEDMKAGGTPHERMTLMLMERIEQLEDRLEEQTRKDAARLQKLQPAQTKKKKPLPSKRPPSSCPEPEYVCEGVYRVYSHEDGSWKWLSEN